MNANPLTRPVPAIVQQMEADQTRTWDEIVDSIAQLAVSEDEAALLMGDRFLELERRFGKQTLRKAADEAGVTWSLAKLRFWVARKIPVGNPIRESKLSFNHLAAVAGTDDMEKWINLALKDQLVAFTVGKEARKRVCSVECAMRFFAERPIESEDLLAQDVQDVQDAPTAEFDPLTEEAMLDDGAPLVAGGPAYRQTSNQSPNLFRRFRPRLYLITCRRQSRRTREARERKKSVDAESRGRHPEAQELPRGTEARPRE
jgi:hypothetical protein